MKKLIRTFLPLTAVLLLFASANSTFAQQRQNRGNFDPQQARERMMERYRTQLELTDDATWTAIEPRIQKVLDARRDVGGNVFGGMNFRGGRGGGGTNAPADSTQGQPRTRRNNAGAQADQGNQNQNQNRRGPQLSPAAQELRQAIDAKASSEDIKTKLASYREDRKQKQAKLEAAQEELRKVLSVRQEASAVLMGLLQ